MVNLCAWLCKGHCLLVSFPTFACRMPDHTTSGAQFAALPFIKPVVEFVCPVVNRCSCSVAKSAQYCHQAPLLSISSILLTLACLCLFLNLFHILIHFLQIQTLQRFTQLVWASCAQEQQIMYRPPSKVNTYPKHQHFQKMLIS